MDPISIIASVIALASALQTWLSAREEQNEVVQSLSFTVKRISAIIDPLHSKDTAERLNPAVVDTFRGLGEALLRTREHLGLLEDSGDGGSANVYKRVVKVVKFLRPADVVKKLQNDERQLTNQLVLVLFAITTQSFFNNHVPGRGGHDTTQGEIILAGVTNREIREFWRDYVGAKVVCVPPEVFIASVKAWYRSGLPESTCNHLLFRLDEYAVGGITPSALEDLAGEKSLREVVDGFKQQNETKFHQLTIQKVLPASRRSANPSLPSYSEYPDLPLLIWVDDKPGNNANEVAFARGLGIMVIELTSTALAKAWFEENEEFVRANDTPTRIRVISDNARYEADTATDGFYMNMSAGEDILRYLRGRQYIMPVLVYCGYSIRTTSYVLQYEEAGSCNSPSVARRYCEALAQRRSDDTAWKGFRSG